MQLVFAGIQPLLADASAGVLAEIRDFVRAALGFPLAVAGADIIVVSEMSAAGVVTRAYALAVEPVPDLASRAFDLLARV